MGLRQASFTLCLDGTLPANAGLVIETYDQVSATIASAGREVPTTTVWSGKLIAGDPAASSYMVLRPTTGDWPIGTLEVRGCRSWFDFTTSTTKLDDRALFEGQVIVGPAVAAAPPTCEFVSAPITIQFATHPGGGSRAPAAGVVVAGVKDAHGLVSIDVEYTLAGIAHVCRAHDIARGGTAVELQGSPEAIAIQRVTITNLLGDTLELAPPFPRGTPPPGPLGWKS